MKSIKIRFKTKNCVKIYLLKGVFNKNIQKICINKKFCKCENVRKKSIKKYTAKILYYTQIYQKIY